MVRLFIVVLLLGIAAPAFSCDITAGPGAVMRLSEGRSGGLFTMGCIGHVSNDGLDYGVEKKNLGMDHIRAEVWF